MSDINSAIRRSVSIYFVGRYSNIAIQLGVTALLARMLVPADFGVIAVVSVLVTLFSFLSEMGLGPAVIQFRDLGSDRLCALFWLSVGMGIVVAVLFACSGPAIAHFYHEPRYVDIAALLSFSIASSCWGIVPLAMLRKAQRFRAIVLIEVTAAVLSGLAALVSARSGAGVLALVVKSNVYGVLMFALALTASRLDLRRRPCWSGMGRLMKYSGYQFLFNLVNYVSRNLDKLLIGKWMGPAALGVYDMSYRLMLMPVSNLTQVISPALQPVYAACGDRDVIFGSYRNVLRLLAIVGGYAGLCCLMCSREIILLIYGPKWGAAAGIFTILSYSIAIQVVLSSTGAIFQVIGRTDLLALSGTLSAVSTVGAMLLGARSGDLSVFSWWVIGSFAMNAVQAFVLLAHAGLGRTVVDLLKPMLPCFCLTAALTLAGVLLPARWDAPGWPVGISLIVKLATVTAAYGLGLAVTGDVAFLKRAVGRRNRAASMGGDHG